MAIQPTSSSIPVAPPIDIRPRGDQRSATTTELTKEPATDKATSTDKNATTETTASIKQPSPQEQVKEAADKANHAISALKSNLQFTVDKDSGVNVVKIVDTETKQTIRQIPSEEMISIARRLEEIKGLLIKNSA